MNFKESWAKYIVPLAGKEISLFNGRKFKLISVSINGVERISSKNNKSHISIDVFSYAFEEVIQNGFVSRAQINEKYRKRCSSAVIAILQEMPFIEFTSSKPAGITVTSHYVTSKK